MIWNGTSYVFEVYKQGDDIVVMNYDGYAEIGHDNSKLEAKAEVSKEITKTVEDGGNLQRISPSMYAFR